MSGSPAPRFDPVRRRAVTAALLLVTALASFESTVVSTAMPTIIGDLGGLPLYAWVFSIYLLTSTIGMPVYGRLADIHGRRRLLLVAIGLFLAGGLACAFARSMPQLIVARAVQGLGAAGLVPVALTVAADLYSLEQRARVQSLFSGIWGFASLVGPLLGAFLTVHFGWRSIFSINIPLGLVAFFLVATRMIESRAPLADPIDLVGSATLALGVTLLLFGVLHAPGPGGVGLPARMALVAAGLAALAVFARLQTRREHPLVPPELFRHVGDGGSVRRRGPARHDDLRRGHVRAALRAGRARRDRGRRRRRRDSAHLLLGALGRRGGAGHPAPRLPPHGAFGAILVLLGLAGLVAGRRGRSRRRGWISAACAVVGAGLGFGSLSQVLAIQHVAAERQRGIATSLVPFFRTVGGSIGVGALGGVFAAGLAARLGSGMEAASRLLAGAARSPPRTASNPSRPPSSARRSSDSLLPVFVVLLALAAVNLFVASGFPRSTTPD